jgi:fatty-acyl-CoA synthase
VATEAELHTHAEAAIAERPAWPKHIFVIDSIPVTSVGKIYKPTLRCDAAARLVTRILQEALGIDGAEVRATEGGSRGMKVSVLLPVGDASSAERVREALGAFLFEIDVPFRNAGAN